MVQWGFMGNIETASGPDMLDRLMTAIIALPKPVIWYAHFAQYDWRYMLDYFVEHKLNVEFGMRSDTTIYQITIKRDDGKRVVMRDSYALFNSPLEKLAASFCPELPKHKIDIANFNPQNPAHVEYARRDIEILLTALPRLMTMLRKNFGVTASGTFSGTAIKGWQATLPENEYINCSVDNARESYIRQAYYGGLVFLTTNDPQTECETYDVNSSYPSVMVDYGVPSGTCYETRDWQDDRMGIYTARVKAPADLIVPILPARNERGAMRWYRGTFETVVTNRELVFAANNGYEILSISEGIAWDDVAFPFNDIIAKCKALRKADKGGPLEYLAKFMQNSIYGKFGARRERLRLFASWNASHDDLLGAEPWGDSGDWYVKREHDSEMRCKPEWAVFITAHARLKLLQAVYSIGVENVIYGDTDSITVHTGHAHNLNVGAEYGQFKLEKRWAKFRAIAPKVYSGVLTNGQIIGAAKGMPSKAMDDAEFSALFERGETVARVESLASLRASMKRGVKPAIELRRVSSSLKNSVHFELTNGIVRPKMVA